MSVQDKIEHVLKSIHLLFSESVPYKGGNDQIIVEKKAVFDLLEQLNLAVYEAMDQYELTTQKQELAERRCEKRGEEIIQKASKHADDIYAASIMYTDDAINRICYIMDDANQAVQDIFRKAHVEMEEQRERVRHNQLELTSQLQDFADTDKYVKLIEEVNRELERERRQHLKGKKEKRIQNEGKSYSVKPEIKINQAYFDRSGKSYDWEQPEEDEEDDAAESLSRVTGKEFAESLRRRAAQSKAKETEKTEQTTEKEESEENTDTAEEKNELEDVLKKASAGLAALAEAEAKEPEIHVDLDAEYFKWKEGEESEPGIEEKKERRFLFGKKHI